MQALKIEKYENLYIFSVLTKDGSKLERSWKFYMTNTEWSKGSWFDCDDTLRVCDEYVGFSTFKFRFFHTCKSYDLYIPTTSLTKFLVSDKKSIIIPAHHLPVITKVEFYSVKNFKAVMANKVVRKKFGKAVMRLLDCTHNGVILTDDYDSLSFEFSKYYKSEFNYNGGLIFHRKDDNLGKGCYNIHT
jgi:hypothetical protein